ncbi:hypothetical protein [Desulfoscipio geothermicus]|uniref:Uncharacterized protein n=1 Tax=Desulfoscipio geothermicus DSM 3669 TaxID=1121426 RepID=A0A1I6E4Q1_9FIRM|nr:hypothetical protein [Desulfoscipio geothermicus]SFR12531.1 hypothetical protein SAMN05660706_12546 [Desulfoscipio geothermicus DSM 3669]
MSKSAMRQNNNYLRVKAWVLRSPNQVKRLVQRMARVGLFDSRTSSLAAGDFWQKGTYFTYYKRPKAVVMVLRPGLPVNRVTLARDVIRCLEVRHGMVLDWCGAARPSGIWLIIKTLAADAADGRNRLFRLNVDDIYATVALVPAKNKPRTRKRGIERSVR